MASATTPTASAATRQRSGGDSTSRVELVPNDRARVSSSHEPERPAHALCFEAEGHARSGHRLPSCGESASAICETMPREHPPRRRDDDDTDQGGRLAAPTPGNCAAQESLLQSCDASQLESVASWKTRLPYRWATGGHGACHCGVLQAYPGWSFAAWGAAVIRREFGPVDIACLDQPPGAVWGQLTGDMASNWQATDSQLALAAGGAGR